MRELAGTGSLLRLALRRDRVLAPAVVLTFAAMAGYSASATTDLFPTAASILRVARTSNATPALVGLYGWIYDERSAAAVGLSKMIGYGGALVGVFTALLVVRHTRSEEEAGRLELVGATAVGRHASLAAAVLVGAGAALATGTAAAVGLWSVGLPGRGAVAFGVMWTVVGLAFTSVGAVAAQVTPSARPARGIASGAVGVAYLLRAVGDVAGDHGPSALSWLSPVGWGQQVRPFAGDRFAVALLPLAFAVAVTGVAFLLARRRDLGAGLVAERAGPGRAGRALSSAWGLAWRLHRGVLVGWCVGFAVYGAVVGALASGVGDLFDDPSIRDIITRLGGQEALVDAFLVAEVGVLTVLAAVYAVTATLHLHHEEVAHRGEAVLVAGVPRGRWVLVHATLAAAGATVLLAVGGLCSGVAHAARVHDPGQAPRVLAAALARVPVVLVVIGVVVVAFGLRARLAVGASWALLVAFVLIGELGELFDLPRGVMDLSPFAHAPALPGGPAHALSLVGLTAVAVGLTAFGLVAYRRRDLG